MLNIFEDAIQAGKIESPAGSQQNYVPSFISSPEQYEQSMQPVRKKEQGLSDEQIMELIAQWKTDVEIEKANEDFVTQSDLTSWFKTNIVPGIASLRPMGQTEVAESLLWGAERIAKDSGTDWASKTIGTLGWLVKYVPGVNPPKFLQKAGQNLEKAAWQISEASKKQELAKWYNPDSTAGQIGRGLGYAVPIAGAIAGGTLWAKVVWPKITNPTIGALPQKEVTNKFAGSISTKANRFIGQKPTEDFVKMTGETPGEYMVNRWVTTTGDKALEESTVLYKRSMDEADKAFDALPNPVRWVNAEGKDVVRPMLDDLSERLKFVDSKDSPRIEALKARYDVGDGLTMSEINDLKRTYSQNFKYTFSDNTGKDAVRSSNLQNNLREWQFKTAEDMGLTNIAEINKNTQAWKTISNNLWKSLSRTAGNNAVTLTDWIALSGGWPTNLALFLGKKALGSDYVKRKIISGLSKQVKPAIIEASNLSKNATINNVLPNVSNIGNKPVVKPKVIPPKPQPKVTKPTVQPKNPIKGSIFDLSDKRGSFKVGVGETGKVIKKPDALIEKIPKIEENFLVKYAKWKTLDEFLSNVRWSSTQYWKYEPRLRRYLKPGSKRLSDFFPESDKNKFITVYRWIDKSENSRIKSQINSWDFVTTDYDDALSYTDSPSNVVSRRIQIYRLVTESPEEFLKYNKNKSIESIYDNELIYKGVGDPFYPISNDRLKEIYNLANIK